MAFFKTRKAAGEPQAPAPAPESVDALRRRARYRLAGAAMLVLAAVVGFPLLFDNQPRPIAVDIPIDIPDKAKVAPLVNSEPVKPNASAPATAVTGVQPVASQPVVTTPAEPEPKDVAKTDSKPAVKETAKVETKPAKAEPKEEVIVSSSSKAATTPSPAKKDDKSTAKSDKADSKPDSKSPDATGRFIVQFGAFSESARAHEARVKVEKAGMKTYAQVIEGAEGKKFRVRVGPFEKRSDAEKAAEKIKKLDLPATVLGL